MIKPTVSVLLSTYNGEKYIRQLVDSVLGQEGVDVKLQVRDDGSTDETLNILASYHDSRIKIYTGENLKPAKSFLELLRICEPSNYYAYCDQDDYWYPNKLITAVNELQKYQEPALFMSTYEVVDKNLEILFIRDMKYEKKFRLQDTIIYRSPSACIMAFNNGLRDEIIKNLPQFPRMHDYWTLLVAEVHKNIIITKNIPLIKYRQHESNVVGIIPSVGTKFKRLWKSLVSGNNERWRQAVDLYTIYKNEIGPQEKEILEKIVFYRDSLKSRLSLLKDKRFKTGDFYIDFLFVLSVLLNRF